MRVSTTARTGVLCRLPIALGCKSSEIGNRQLASNPPATAGGTDLWLDMNIARLVALLIFGLLTPFSAELARVAANIPLSWR